MKTCGGVDVQIHVFLISAMVRGSALPPSRFTPREIAPVTHCTGGWVIQIIIVIIIIIIIIVRSSVVIEALCYKPEGRGFETQ
jgi:hypothetical protein